MMTKRTMKFLKTLIVGIQILFLKAWAMQCIYCFLSKYHDDTVILNFEFYNVLSEGTNLRTSTIARLQNLKDTENTITAIDEVSEYLNDYDY